MFEGFRPFRLLLRHRLVKDYTPKRRTQQGVKPDGARLHVKNGNDFNTKVLIPRTSFGLVLFIDPWCNIPVVQSRVFWFSQCRVVGGGSTGGA